MVIASGSKTTSEYWSATPPTPMRSSAWSRPSPGAVEYGVEHAVIAGEDRLLVAHNDGAENYEPAVAPLDATSPEQWQRLSPTTLPCGPEDVDAFATHLVVSQQRPDPAAGRRADRRRPR